MEEINSIPEWLEDETILIVDDQFESNEEQNFSALSIEYEEHLLVTDIIYCLIGATGVYFKPNKSGKLRLTFSLRNTLNKSFIDLILPLCDNVLTIKTFAEKHFSLENGRVLHALCASLKIILSHYTQLIAKIESYQQLTFAMLASELKPHFDTMQTLSELILKIGFKRGCKVLSIIYSFMLSNSKTEQIKKVLFFIFQSSSAPLLSFIEKFIYAGVIDDPFEEFFIKINEVPEGFEDQYEDRFWQLKFLVSEKQIPIFLPQSSVKKILLSGKSKAILMICGEKPEKHTGISIQSLQRGVVLDSALFSASSQLMNTLRSKYELVKYFHVFHSVYLGGRGSWFSLFFQNASPAFKTQKRRIHLPTLDVSLSMTLPENMKNIFYTDIEDELYSEQVKEAVVGFSGKGSDKMNYHASSTNWDFFNIKARIEWPIVLFFPKSIQQKYQLMFRNILLWRRLEYKLCKLWKSSQKIKLIDNTRQSILLFVRGFLDFISLYVINPQYAIVHDLSIKTRNIEDLFKKHDECINIAFKGLFLTEPRLFNLISCILFYGFQYVKEIKKWIRSISNKVTTITTKKQLARPIFQIFEAFKKKVRSLITKLVELGKSDELYSDFIYWVNVNDFYR